MKTPIIPSSSILFNDLLNLNKYLSEITLLTLKLYSSQQDFKCIIIFDREDWLRSKHFLNMF